MKGKEGGVSKRRKQEAGEEGRRRLRKVGGTPG